MKLIIERRPWLGELQYAVFYAYTAEEIAAMGPADRADAFRKTLYPGGEFATEGEAREWCRLRAKGPELIAEFPL